MEGPRQERINYLYDRGFTDHSIRTFKLGHTGTRISIPFSTAKQFTGVQFRRDLLYCDPDEPKYLNLRGQKSVIMRPFPNGKPTVICEGPMDALLLAQYGIDAVTTSAGARSLTKIKGATTFSSVPIIATDNDQAGDEAFWSLAERYPKARRLLLPDGWDVSDLILSFDVGERGLKLRRWLRERVV